MYFFSVKHLSALLSEAELDVARLTEMNAMLKEELRRQERSAEREKHVQNLEYMKNVIFKVHNSKNRKVDQPTENGFISYFSFMLWSAIG